LNKPRNFDVLKNIALVRNNIDGFLKRLFETAILNNAKKNPKNNQYEESFKRFCIYLFIIGKDEFRNFYILEQHKARALRAPFIIFHYTFLMNNIHTQNHIHHKINQYNYNY